MFMDKRILLAPVVTSVVWNIDKNHPLVGSLPP